MSGGADVIDPGVEGGVVEESGADGVVVEESGGVVELSCRFFRSLFHMFCNASSTTFVANCGSTSRNASMAFLLCSNTPSRYFGARCSRSALLTDSSGSHRTTSSIVSSLSV